MNRQPLNKVIQGLVQTLFVLQSKISLQAEIFFHFLFRVLPPSKKNALSQISCAAAFAAGVRFRMFTSVLVSARESALTALELGVVRAV